MKKINITKGKENMEVLIVWAIIVYIMGGYTCPSYGGIKEFYFGKM
jgi:hypothetical protein